VKIFKAYQLSRGHFADYGDLLSQPSCEPLADNESITYFDRISELEITNPISTGIVEGHQANYQVKSVERHLKTPEILVALSGDFVTLLGIPDHDTDQIRGLKAFYVKQREAIALKQGTWHSVPLPVKESCKALVIFKSGTPDNDLELQELNEKAEIKVN
jgi:ureidoglycolate hydrolase